MNLPSKLYTAYCIFMAGYGASRGYRNKDATFETDKVIFGFFNGLMYGFPILNIEPTIRLLNRLEIRSRGYDKNLYLREYEEFFGTCMDDV